MAHNARFTGLFAAMVTPFTDDASAVSEPRLRAYCDFLIKSGVDGLFAFGTTGEWPLCTEAERAFGARIIVEQARGRVPVIIHAGAHDTEQAIRLATGAREVGADAVSLITPPFFPLDDAALFDHFMAVARAVQGFPVFLYNIPEYAGNDISPELLRRVAMKADNVIGLKYSGNTLELLREYRRSTGTGFSLFSGNDIFALPGLREGADGLVSGNASARPELLAELYAAFKEGRQREAAEKQEKLEEFISARDPSCELSTFKGLCALRGIPVGDVRAPLKRLTADGKAALGRLLQ
jgi:4-hydroxy-tetrahydrodipicolinate synthase